MSFRYIVMGVMILLYVGAEIYVSRKKLHLQLSKPSLRKAMRCLLIGTSVLPWVCIGLLFAFGDYAHTPLPRWQTLVLGLVFALFFTRFAMAGVLLVTDVLRSFRWAWRKVASPEKIQPRDPSRRDFLKRAALVVGALQFGNVVHAITRGKYNFTVRQVTVSFPTLPPAFDGMRIVQLSDFHAGSFDDLEAVREGLQLAQEQNPDLIVFTGDLVNEEAEEAEPYIEMMKGLTAPLGKLAVLGNHDYGHTKVWPSDEVADANHQKVIATYAQMGFNLLLNNSIFLFKDNQFIRVAGVENWGRKPFPQKGNLDQALIGTNSSEFVVLLSHDPTHWDEKTLAHEVHVHLTLSGHTHGAQMGVEIPGFRFSPAQWIYERWAGLYKEGDKHLYVNRGFGHLGFPGRMGISPEIAVIELKRA
jgi:predicted MPP superfamily phosphohydrolase